MQERTGEPDNAGETNIALQEELDASRAGTIEQQGGVTELMRGADERVRKYKLPLMSPPAGLGTEYRFPDDASHLASVELGTLQLKLTGWYSWAIRCLSREATELAAYESTYERALGHAMHDESKRHERRPVKESLKALAIKNDVKLERMSRMLIRKRAVVGQLTDQVKIYEKQLMHLSREQSRREAETRIG